MSDPPREYGTIARDPGIAVGVLSVHTALRLVEPTESPPMTQHCRVHVEGGTLLAEGPEIDPGIADEAPRRVVAGPVYRATRGRHTVVVHYTATDEGPIVVVES